MLAKYEVTRNNGVQFVNVILLLNQLDNDFSKLSEANIANTEGSSTVLVGK